MNQVKIGNYIATKRKAKKMTQSELASVLDISTNAVSKWERGLNMPDIAKIEELCSILDISLNELFKAEDIKDDELSISADNNLFNLFKEFKVKDFKLKIIKLILISVLIVIGLFGINKLLVYKGYKLDSDLAYMQVYYPLLEEVRGNVDIEYFISRSMDFDIGANRLGYAVFKNPRLAFKTFKKDYAEEIKVVQKEFNLGTFNIFNLDGYKNLARQSTKRDIYPDIKFISSFLDIYENSFR